MSRRNVKILFGGPGTGKTTWLVQAVKQALDRGTPPERIGYMSFSRKAAKEALARASHDLSIDPEDFPWFRTLHSAAFKQLGLKRAQVMGPSHYREFGAAVGVTFTGTYDAYTEYAPLDLMGIGDRCLALYARAKARQWTLEQEWRFANEWDLPWPVVRGFVSHLEAYKRDRGVLDFTDMLDAAQQPLALDVMIVDEAQDQTMQQWSAARRFGNLAQEVYVAGDDDQAIYTFSGATAAPLLSMAGERIVLPQSHRLPRSIKGLADRVAANIKVRAPKQFASREEDGTLSWCREPSDVDLSHGTWLLLCRNRSQIKTLENIAKNQNVVYYSEGQWSNESDSVRAVVLYEKLRRGELVTMTDARIIRSFLPSLLIPDNGEKLAEWSTLGWPFEEKPNWMEALELPSSEREYIRGLRRRNESLTKPGRVTISTVHGAKGGEADHVMLLTDISGRVAQGFLVNPDNEWRVVYVGVSRAKSTLTLCAPQTRNFWSLAA